MRSWDRAGIRGHSPNFKIECEFCREPMVFRYSQIMFNPKLIKTTWYRRLIVWLAKKMEMICSPNGYGDPVANAVEYKCSLCGNTAIFDISDDKEYLKEVSGKRGGIALYYPPKEEWANENDRIREKLEALGYL